MKSVDGVVVLPLVCSGIMNLSREGTGAEEFDPDPFLFSIQPEPGKDTGARESPGVPLGTPDPESIRIGP